MFISDLITTQEIETWQRGDNILIKSQTGSGKSHFMINVLARYCEEHNLKTIIFSNRDLLNQQNKKLALKNVECFNYQYMEKMTPEAIKRKLDKYDVINADECHYFFEDASFNRNTEKVLQYLLTPSNQIKIFASATPEPMYHTGIKFAKQYDVPHDYSFVEQLVFYNDFDEIQDFLLKDEFKTLCFVGNAERGCHFAFEHPDLADFICSKNNALWRFSAKSTFETIVEKSRFAKKILLATTVIENGINIVDKKLKNIVVDIYDPLAIVQALGRKRLQENDRVRLFLRVPTKQQIKRKKFAPSQSKSLAAQIYNGFVREHFTNVDEVGFVTHWISFFEMPLEKVAYVSNWNTIENFMRAHCNQSVTRLEVEDLFRAYISIAPNMKLALFNRFMEKHNIPFKIETKLTTKRENRKRYWIVKPL
ncbi:MAG: DEAD/DEAH box helicase family protein [Methanobrevibacter sp.]|nr:DEAD/DEAH box helicase family protein [Methanobrevibacter sp.]